MHGNDVGDVVAYSAHQVRHTGGDNEYVALHRLVRVVSDLKHGASAADNLHLVICVAVQARASTRIIHLAKDKVYVCAACLPMPAAVPAWRARPVFAVEEFDTMEDTTDKEVTDN